MRQIKVNQELFSKYRKAYKGQITVYENCAKQQDLYIPFQHIIVVKDTNKVLDVITLDEEYQHAKELYAEMHWFDVETAQKELDKMLAKKARFEARKARKELESFNRFEHKNVTSTNTLAEFLNK